MGYTLYYGSYIVQKLGKNGKKPPVNLFDPMLGNEIFAEPYPKTHFFRLGGISDSPEGRSSFSISRIQKNSTSPWQRVNYNNYGNYKIPFRIISKLRCELSEIFIDDIRGRIEIAIYTGESSCLDNCYNNQRSPRLLYLLNLPYYFRDKVDCEKIHKVDGFCYKVETRIFIGFLWCGPPRYEHFASENFHLRLELPISSSISWSCSSESCRNPKGESHISPHSSASSKNICKGANHLQCSHIFIRRGILIISPVLRCFRQSVFSSSNQIRLAPRVGHSLEVMLSQRSS